MDVIFSASIIAAFLAGMVALFAPCCITVLLPAYLASAFREKRHILKMTFVFFAGIAVIIVPIGLGAAALAQFFRNFHQEMYIFGGVFMVILAALAVSGRGLAMIPMPKTPPKPGASHPRSVFVLGIFSGAATSCCAPVLAGAVTLAVISGVFWKALVVTFAYVFGMTFPLFIAAYFYDKYKIEESRIIQGKLFEVKLPVLAKVLSGRGAGTFYVHSTNLIAGFVFLVMGIILLLLGFSGNAFWSPTFQAKIGGALNRWSQSALGVLMNVPDLVWGIIIIGIFLFLLYRVKRDSSI